MRYVVFGKIGSGKSTVAKQMAQTLGAPYFNVDTWVAQWYETSHGQAWLHEHMGVSDKKGAMAYLKSHPEMWEPLIEQTALYVDDCFHDTLDDNHTLILEFPLLPQYPRYKNYFDYAVWVTAPYEIRYARVMSRDGMDPERFELLNNRQGDDATYEAMADWELRNDGSWDIENWIDNLHVKKELLLQY